MKKALCLTIVLLLSCQTVFGAPVSTVIAPTYYLADLQNGNVLLEENCTTNVMPGDFSKIMTAVLAIEQFSPTDLLTFQEESISFYNTFGNIANIKAGTTFTVLEHLQNMLLLYSDASANALAIAHSGNVDDFTTKMNEKAAEIGMKDTVFSSPSGYDLHNISKTTVYDLATLYRYALQLDLFHQVVQQETFDLPPLKEGGENRTFSNRNHLISRYTYTTYVYSPTMDGIHSFSQDSASFIATAKRGNKQLLAIVVNSPDNQNMTVYKDMINLFEYGFGNFYYQSISQENDIIHQIPVLGGKSAHVTLVTEMTQSALLPVEYDSSKLEKKISVPESVWAPVEKGAVLGTISYFYEGKFVGSVNLVADQQVKFSIFATIERAILTRINSVFLFVVISVGVIILIFIYQSRKKREDRKRRKREIMKHTQK